EAQVRPGPLVRSWAAAPERRSRSASTAELTWSTISAGFSLGRPPVVAAKIQSRAQKWTGALLKLQNSRLKAGTCRAFYYREMGTGNWDANSCQLPVSGRMS